MILALALSPSMDVTYEVGHLQHGGITRPTRVTRVAGGKALNMSRVAAALGGGVRAVVVLGGTTGDGVAALLESESIGATVIPVAGETRTCVAIVEVDGGATSTDLYERAAAVTADEWHRFASAARAELAARPDWVVLSGSVPDGVPLTELAALLRSAAAAGSRVAVDASGPVLRALAGSATLVKVNRAEAEGLLDLEVSDALEAAREVAARFGVDAIVTDGVRPGGACLAGVERTIDPPSRPGRFPAGSGDAFLGGLLAALDAGEGRDEALAQAGNAAERNAAMAGQGRLA